MKASLNRIYPVPFTRSSAVHRSFGQSPFIVSSRSIPPSRSNSHSSMKSASPTNLAARIPPGTWDTHMHVVDPHRFPLDSAAQYQPSPHSLDQAQTSLGQLGIRNMVIVQPSIYGNDNSCTLDGLRRLGPKQGRAVIQFDPAETSKTQLQEWHDLGVRGVRLNFKSVGETPDAAALQQSLHAYANAVRDFGWVLELYIGIEEIPLLEPVVKELGGVQVCIDHLGQPSAKSLSTAKAAEDVPGFSSFLGLLEQGNAWVKLSATYRLNKDPGHPLTESLCRAVLKCRPDRCVFATDWPHTRFEDVQVEAYIQKVLEWCEAEGVSLQQVLVTNAEQLFDAKN